MFHGIPNHLQIHVFHIPKFSWDFFIGIPMGQFQVPEVIFPDKMWQGQRIHDRFHRIQNYVHMFYNLRICKLLLIRLKSGEHQLIE